MSTIISLSLDPSISTNAIANARTNTSRSPSTERIACARIPDFAVRALGRHDPALAGQAIAIGGVPPERGHVLAVSPEARRQGLRPGMTLSAAEALLPQTRFFPADPDLEGRETRALAEVLDAFTPRVELAPPDPGGAILFFLDTRGLGRHHASEEAFARRVAAALSARGYPATLGIAGTRFAAEVAARTARDRPGLVAAGGEVAFLAPLPLAHLPFTPEMLDEVLALGLTTIGAWAALPPETVGARFGSRGLEIHALACGAPGKPLVSSPIEEPLEVAIDLDEPVEDLDLLTFHLKRAVDSLARRLVARGLATAAVRVTLALEDHAERAAEARFVRPTLAPRLIIDCLRLALQRETLPARITSFRLGAIDTAPARPEQLLLFARQNAAVDRAAVEAALTRVRAMVGPDGLVSPRAGDSHRPEAQVRWEPYPGLPEPAPPAAGTPRRTSPTLSRPARSRPAPPLEPPVFGGLPARLLAKPLAAEVEAAGSRLTFVAAETVRGRVSTTDGPHLVAGEWWGNAYERAYFAVTLGDGGRYWLYRDLLAGGWFLHGMFD